MNPYNGDLNHPNIDKIYKNGFTIFYKSDDIEGYKRMDFEARLENEIVAQAFFVMSDEKLHCNDVEVSEDHRRKGIATSLYVAAENIFQMPVSNMWDGYESQEKMGRALWKQPNRPFGNES